jgi:hypothetical protein
MAGFPAAQTLAGTSVEALAATSYAEAEAATLAQVESLPSAVAVVAGFQRSARPPAAVALGLAVSLPSAAVVCFPPPVGPTEGDVLARVAPLTFVMAVRFPQPEEPTEAASGRGSGYATRSARNASIPTFQLARSLAKAAHRIYPASGESGRAREKAAPQTPAPQHGRHLPGERQSLRRQSGQQHPAQRKKEPSRIAEEVSWRGERTPAPRGLASSRRWREEVRRRRGSAGVFEAAFDARFSRPWKHLLREF